MQRGAYYVPTLGITHLTPSQARTPWERAWVEQRALTPELIRRAEDAVEEHKHWFRRALAAGVKMASGSDARPVRTARCSSSACGCARRDALAGPSGRHRWAAEVSGAAHDLGTIEPGKLADLIAVRANPLEDIDNVRTLQLVFKAGHPVADHRQPGSDLEMPCFATAGSGSSMRPGYNGGRLTFKDRTR